MNRGKNSFGQIGQPYLRSSPSSTATPTAVATDVGNWTMVSAGDTHSCGVAINGTGYCWGLGGSNFNVQSKLGNGMYGIWSTPTGVTFPTGVTAWVEIGAGYDFSCGRDSKGGVYCWGGSAACRTVCCLCRHPLGATAWRCICGTGTLSQH